MKIKNISSLFNIKSSSVHAIILPKYLSKIEMPSKVNLYLIDNLIGKCIIKEFEDKLSFLFTILYILKSNNEIKYLIYILKSFNIDINIIDNRINNAIEENKYIDIFTPNIDNISIIIRQILYNNDLLLKYLFNNSLVDYDYNKDIFKKYHLDIYDVLI